MGHLYLRSIVDFKILSQLSDSTLPQCCLDLSMQERYIYLSVRQICHTYHTASDLLCVAPSSKKVTASVHEADGCVCECFPNYCHPLERCFNNVKITQGTYTYRKSLPEFVLGHSE